MDICRNEINEYIHTAQFVTLFLVLFVRSRRFKVAKNTHDRECCHLVYENKYIAYECGDIERRSISVP